MSLRDLFGKNTTPSPELAALLSALKQEAVSLTYGPAGAPLPPAASKIGGQPDLPPDFVWYRYTGSALRFSYDDDGSIDWNRADSFLPRLRQEEEQAERPLSFLAQINLAEVAALDGTGLLPRQGMLYFFYELDSMPWGYDPSHKNAARVYHYTGPLDVLTATAPPADLPTDFLLPELPLHFAKETSLPSPEEFFYLHREETRRERDLEAYDAARATLGVEESRLSGENFRLLGYADVVQNEMQLECELVSRDIPCGNGPEPYRLHGEALHQPSKDWTLLFQMGTVATADYELMWGDMGYLYFYIRKSDLAQQNFDHVRLILQCG